MIDGIRILTAAVLSLLCFRWLYLALFTDYRAHRAPLLELVSAFGLALCIGIVVRQKLALALVAIGAIMVAMVTAYLSVPELIPLNWTSVYLLGVALLAIISAFAMISSIRNT